MPVIEIQDVSKLYGFGDATTVALDEINLVIEQGEFVAIMGASGSGKSTLMNMIGLLDRPTHGRYKLSGRQVERLRPNQRARARRDTVGFVFQSFNLLPRINVLENVALPLMYRNITQTRRLKMASAMLQRIGLADREYFYPKQLSGGQAQRVAIARALVNSPKIIIADEPTGNLDSVSSRLVMELLADIHKTGSTVLMVTHNPELTKYATRVVYMHDGAIIADEQSPLGEVANLARRSMYFSPINEDDDLAGVSELMKAIPSDAPFTPKKRSKKAKKTRVKKYTSRTKKSKGKK